MSGAKPRKKGVHINIVHIQIVHIENISREKIERKPPSEDGEKNR